MQQRRVHWQRRRRPGPVRVASAGRIWHQRRLPKEPRECFAHIALLGPYRGGGGRRGAAGSGLSSSGRSCLDSKGAHEMHQRQLARVRREAAAGVLADESTTFRVGCRPFLSSLAALWRLNASAGSRCGRDVRPRSLRAGGRRLLVWPRAAQCNRRRAEALLPGRRHRPRERWPRVLLLLLFAEVTPPCCSNEASGCVL